MHLSALLQYLARPSAAVALLFATTVSDLETRAWAQAYPTKPIRIIVSNAPGASTDIIARAVAQSMSQRLGVSVFVDNRAGASGIIGTVAAAQAEPDGYTLLFGTQDTLTLLPILKKSLPYDPERDFTAVTKVSDVYLLLACNSNVPANSLKEFVALAKAKPNTLKFSSAGIGGINHLATELFSQTAGIELLHVPYRGGAPATFALFAGEVDLMAGSVSLLGEGMASGKLRGLAIARQTRSQLASAVPTMQETGVGDVVAAAYFGIVAPKATPRDIVELLSSTVVAIVATPEFRQRVAAAGGEAVPLGADDFDKYLKTESHRWRQVIERAHIKLDEP
jgi:tripartite-type tricarboxylate transporter receptor subunit TctC